MPVAKEPSGSPSPYYEELWALPGRQKLCEPPRYCWHLGCILPRVPAISLRTRREKSWVDKGFIPPVVTFNETLEWIRQMHLISGGMPQIVYGLLL